MATKGKVSNKSIVAALIAADGNVAAAGRALGITRQSIGERIARNPKIQAVLDEFEILAGDYATGNIMRALIAGDVATSRWWKEKRDPDFKNGSLRLDDDQIRALIEASTPEALRKLAGAV